MAEDVTYSGTIAAAMEGTLLGVPSIALSQAYGPETGRKNIHWACAETHGPDLIRKVLDLGIPRNVLINVNFPDCPADSITGLEVATSRPREVTCMPWPLAAFPSPRSNST